MDFPSFCHISLKEIREVQVHLRIEVANNALKKEKGCQ